MEWRTVVVTVLVVSLCFLAIPIRVDPDITERDIELFRDYVARHNKSYRHDPEEYDKRFERFQRSLRSIEKMNAMRTSNESALYGLTRFSDLSEEEFLESYLRRGVATGSGDRPSHPSHRAHLRAGSGEDRSRRSTATRVGVAPGKFDWRGMGVVTAVRSQGVCGACWAFSTVEVAESMFAIKNGTLRQLSVQQMIDCAGNGNFGCEGGDICNLLAWLVSSKVNILPDSSYPLTRQTGACKLEKPAAKTSGIRVTDFTCDNFVGAEDSLQKTIASHGPVAVAVNALTWQNYLGGVIHFHCDGSFASLNHAVQVVGYDATAPTPFYVVRNSWGTDFGDKGYLYVGIGGNMCGIANQVSSLDVM